MDDSEGQKSNKGLTGLEKFQIFVSVFVSLATAFIAWKTFELNEQANANNVQLKEIENQLSEQRFGFERIRDIYDRTEKYLASEQDERRGRALVVLISSLPKSPLRANLLSIVAVEATQVSVSVAAADSYVGSSLSKVPKKLEFIGEPAVEWLSDGRTFRITAEFGFRDSKGLVWTVPIGALVDGTSIPKIAWSTMAPFDGEYRRAVILHDYYSSQRTRSTEDVNHMFYEALIASGVSEVEAKVLYVAVRTMGPRWNIKENSSSR